MKEKVEKYLREHYGKKPTDEIAKQLNLKKGTVWGYARELGLTKRKRSLEVAWNIIRRNPSKHTYTGWSRELKISTPVIQQFMDRNNLTPRKYLDTDKKQKLKNLIKNNLTMPLRRLSFLTGYTISEIRYLRKKIAVEIIEEFKNKGKYLDVIEDDKKE